MFVNQKVEAGSSGNPTAARLSENGAAGPMHSAIIAIYSMHLPGTLAD